jgi:phage terminase small subunit
MAMPRQPTEVLKAKGSYATNPGRLEKRRPAEPRGWKDIPPPPAHLDAALVPTWEELRGLMHPRVCNVPDVVPFEALVRLVYKMRTDFDGMTAAQMGQLTRMCTEFGMTPASRSKVQQAPEPPAADPWDEFKH